MTKSIAVAFSVLSVTLIVLIGYVSWQVFSQKNVKPNKKKATIKKKKEEKEKEKKIVSESEKLRTQGNLEFKKRNYADAITLYKKSISESNSKDSDNLAKCYANVACCFIKLKKYEEGVLNCTKALEYDAKYIKALQRRASAHSALNNFESAIDDYMIMMKVLNPEPYNPTNVSKSQTEGMTMINDLLRQLSTQKLEIILKEKIGQFNDPNILNLYYLTLPSRALTQSLEEIQIEVSEGNQEKRIDLGLKYIELNQFQQALDLFKEILIDNPDHVEALVESAVLLHLSGNVAESLELFSKANELKPDDPYTLVKWANTLIFSKQPEMAEKLFQKANTLKPKDETILFHWGEAYSSQKNFVKAIEIYSELLKTFPNHYYGLNHLGLVYLAGIESNGNSLMSQLFFLSLLKVEPSQFQEMLENAEKTFQLAIQCEPNNPYAYNNYGLLLAMFRRYDESLEQFEKAIKLNPNNSKSYSRMGFVKLQSTGDCEKSLKLFNKAIELDENNVEALCNIALTHLSSSNLKEAISTYAIAIQKSSVLSLDLPQIIYYQETAKMQQRFEAFQLN